MGWQSIYSDSDQFTGAAGLLSGHASANGVTWSKNGTNISQNLSLTGAGTCRISAGTIVMASRYSLAPSVTLTPDVIANQHVRVRMLFNAAKIARQWASFAILQYQPILGLGEVFGLESQGFASTVNYDVIYGTLGEGHLSNLIVPVNFTTTLARFNETGSVLLDCRIDEYQIVVEWLGNNTALNLVTLQPNIITRARQITGTPSTADRIQTGLFAFDSLPDVDSVEFDSFEVEHYRA